MFKTADPQTDQNKILKSKVLNNVGDLFNELYYIYKDKYNEEKDGLDTKNKKNFYYKKLRITNDDQYESEEEKKEEEEQQISKKLDKKEPPKISAKVDVNKFNEWVNKEEIDRNSEIFQKNFKFQRPSYMLKTLYTTNDKKKNSKLVNIIKSELSDLKNETENMSEEEKEIEKPNEIVNIVEEIFEFNKKTHKGQGLKTLTADQMFSRLPITLAHLKVGK